jgi:membrane protein implicated in regulation of membrane protease activity
MEITQAHVLRYMGGLSLFVGSVIIPRFEYIAFGFGLITTGGVVLFFPSLRFPAQGICILIAAIGWMLVMDARQTRKKIGRSTMN